MLNRRLALPMPLEPNRNCVGGYKSEWMKVLVQPKCVDVAWIHCVQKTNHRLERCRNTKVLELGNLRINHYLERAGLRLTLRQALGWNSSGFVEDYGLSNALGELLKSPAPVKKFPGRNNKKNKTPGPNEFPVQLGKNSKKGTAPTPKHTGTLA